MDKIRYQDVYYVSSPQDETVLLATHVIASGAVVRWLDTVKERVMAVERWIEHTPRSIIFERSKKEGGGTYTFTPLTLEIYQENVKSKLMSPKEFQTEREMKECIKQSSKAIE